MAGYSGTLGDIINNEASYHLSGVIGAAICIAALALVAVAFTGLVDALIGGALTPRAAASRRGR